MWRDIIAPHADQLSRKWQFKSDSQYRQNQRRNKNKNKLDCIESIYAKQKYKTKCRTKANEQTYYNGKLHADDHDNSIVNRK